MTEQAAGTVTAITFPDDTRIRVYIDGDMTGPPVIVGSCARTGPRSVPFTLWASAGQPAEGDETGHARSFAELRERLQDRIARNGRWWQ